MNKYLIFITLLLIASKSHAQIWRPVLVNFELYTKRFSYKKLNNDEFENLYKLQVNKLYSSNATISNFYEFQKDRISLEVPPREFAIELKRKYTGSSFNLDLNSAKAIQTTDVFPKEIVQTENKSNIVNNLKVYTNINFTEFQGKKLECSEPIYLVFDLFCYGETSKTCKILKISNLSELGLDTDGDGFLDQGDHLKDLCLYTSGTVKGCLDWDGDGFHNGNGDPREKDSWEDKCPYMQGTKDGCPDEDRDGIIDSIDKCPEKIGHLITGIYEEAYCGCPDSDGDNVPDELDKCPNTFGIVNDERESINGCPDFDKDGLVDGEDSCPCLVGSRITNGCPDFDSDGVLDDLDSCPKKFGTSADGCSERFKYKGRTEKVFTEKEAIIHLQIVYPYLIAATENGELGIFYLDRFQNNPKKLYYLIEKEKKPFLIEDQYETFYVNNSKDLIIITSAKSKLESGEKKQYSEKKLTFPYSSLAPLNSDSDITADSAKSIIREANLSFAQTNFTELLNKLGKDITLEKEILVDSEVYRDIKDKNSYLLAIINKNLYLYKNHTVFYDDSYRKLFKLENQPQKLENRLNVKSGTFNNNTGELFIAGEDGVIYIYQKENVPLNSND